MTSQCHRISAANRFLHFPTKNKAIVDIRLHPLCATAPLINVTNRVHLSRASWHG